MTRSRNRVVSNRFFTSPPQWAMILTDGNRLAFAAERYGLSHVVIRASISERRARLAAPKSRIGNRVHLESLLNRVRRRLSKNDAKSSSPLNTAILGLVINRPESSM